MAASDPHVPCDTVGFAHEPDGDMVTQPSVQVEDSQYQETSSLHHEEAVSETQLDSETTRSAGTVQSISVDSDHVEISGDLAVDTHASQEQTRDKDATSIGSKLFSRPKSAGNACEENWFSFALASRQQMDFLGPRKGQRLSMPLNNGNTRRSSLDNPGVEDVAEDTAVATHRKTPHTPTAPAQCSEAGQLITATDPWVPSREAFFRKTKRKNRKRHRYDTVSENPITRHDVATPIETVEELQCGVGLDDSSGIPVEHSNASMPVQELECQTDSPRHVPTTEKELSETVSPVAQGTNEAHNAATQTNELIGMSSPSLSVQTQGVITSAGPAQPTPSLDKGLTQDVETRARPREDNAAVNADQVLHALSHRHGIPKVSKPKSKTSRKATSPAISEHELSNDQLSDINDYMQIVSYKICQMKKGSEEEMIACREHFEVELRKIDEVKQVLQNQLQNVRLEKERLAATVVKQQEKLVHYESKFRKSKTFIDGLGNDIDTLKKDANADRNKREELAQEANALKTERDDLFAKLSASAESFAKLEKETLDACKETKLELEKATYQRHCLERDLSEKVGMLVEERDRCSQLQQQVNSQRASSLSADQNILGTLKSNKESILEKLSEISTGFQNKDRSSGASGMLEETRTAVQALNSQADITVRDVAAAKDLIEKMNKSVTEHLHSTTQTSEEATAHKFQARLDNALGSLKEELVQREERIQQDAGNREHIKSLQEKLKESDARIMNAELQVSTAQDNEKKLKEENEKLQARINGLQSEISPNESLQVQLNETKAELDNKCKALESREAALTTKTDELRNLSVSNSNLQQQLRSLQSRFEELQSPVVDFTPEKEELERKAKADVEQVRKEMADHAEKFEAELKTQTGNELKRLTSERNRLEKQLNPLKDELSICKTRIQELENSSSSGCAAKNQEVEMLRNLAQSQKQEMKALQVSLNNERNSARSDASLKKDYSLLTAQFESERKKLLQVSGENSALLKRVEGLQSTTEEATLARDQAKSELDRLQTDKDKATTALQKELSESNAALGRSEAGREQFKKSCNDAIDETKRKRDQDIKALQERVSEAEGELDAEKEAAKRFREDVERSWQSQQEDHETRIAEIERNVADAESQRDEALRNNELIRLEMQQALDEQRDTFTKQLQNAQRCEEKLKLQQPSGQVSLSTTRLHIPKVIEDITPTACLEPKARTKPTKRVDRNSHRTIEDSPVPVTEELRPDSCNSDSVKSSAKSLGPVVEESQVVSDSYADKVASHEEPTPKRIITRTSTGSDDILSMIDNGSRLLPETVAETQSQEELPSFAAFNTGLVHPSQTTAPNLSSLKFFQTSSHEVRDYAPEGTPENSHVNAGLTKVQPSGDFTAYEDSQVSHEMVESGEFERCNERQDSFPHGQEERNRYTYQKSFPHPNSASKLVHRENRATGMLKRRSDNLRSPAVPRNSAIRIETGQSSSGRLNTATSVKSSTPDFMNASNDRKSSKYHTLGGSGGNVRLSRKNFVPTADARLAVRDAAATSKRKSEGQIVRGYEQERKRRPSAHPSAGQREERQVNPYSQTESSMNDTPTFSSMHDSLPSSQQSSGLTTQSKKRTLAGRNSRNTRGAKKLSKHDEFNGRFSQELAGR